MANMSYCRFENTDHDFMDCLIALEEDGLESLSERERIYAKKLYENCKDFIEIYEDCEENPEGHRLNAED